MLATIVSVIPWAQVASIVAVIQSGGNKRLVAAVQLLHLCTEIEEDEAAEGPNKHSAKNVTDDIERIIIGMGNGKWLEKVRNAYQESIGLRTKGAPGPGLRQKK